MRTLRLTALLLVFAALPGCIVGDIHDELKGVNARLERVEETLSKIDSTNERLDLLHARLDTLDRLESIDGSLTSIDGELVAINEELDPIKDSLENLDAHLASLRKTISNIDSTIPFLKFSDEGEETEYSEEAGTGAPDGSQQDAEQRDPVQGNGQTEEPPESQPDGAPTGG